MRLSVQLELNLDPGVVPRCFLATGAARVMVATSYRRGTGKIVKQCRLPLIMLPLCGLNMRIDCRRFPDFEL